MSVDYNVMPDADFRAMLRDFIRRECPVHLINQARRVRWAEARDWCLKLSKRGWLAPAWPVEHGGMGLNTEKLLAYHSEFETLGVSRTPDIGIVMLGMLLVRFGTREQKAHYLPRILDCQDVWCQGYSEPGSGSDLASLTTRAVRDGDAWVLNGQKIWTTLAQDATDIFLLARTNSDAQPQKGITFLMARMDTPGITVRPIRTLAGDEEFCEVFFDDVRISVENVVGEVDDGWSMAKALLGFERLTHGSPRMSQAALERLGAMARDIDAFGDPAFADRFIQFHLDMADLAETFDRFAQSLRTEGVLGADVSILKIWGTELYQRIAEAMVDLAADHGSVVDGLVVGAQRFDPAGYYFLSRPTTIYGGSNEIQRNILAKHVLGMQ